MQGSGGRIDRACPVAACIPLKMGMRWGAGIGLHDKRAAPPFGNAALEDVPTIV